MRNFALRIILWLQKNKKCKFGADSVKEPAPMFPGEYPYPFFSKKKRRSSDGFLYKVFYLYDSNFIPIEDSDENNV